MDEWQQLNRSYWSTLERIMDIHGVTGDRSFAKIALHKKIKKAKGIAHMSRMRSEDLRHLIDEINDFFPLTDQL